MKHKWGQVSVNTIKMNFGILMGLLILCVGLTFLTDKFATVTNFLQCHKTDYNQFVSGLRHDFCHPFRRH